MSALWRFRDSEDDEWMYSVIPVNPYKWTFVEVYEMKVSWAAGVRL